MSTTNPQPVVAKPCFRSMLRVGAPVAAALVCAVAGSPARAQVVETVLHDFLGASDGANPPAGVVLDTDDRSGVPRAIYGTTTHGGSFAFPTCSPYGGCGTLFKLTPPTAGGGAAWAKTQLWKFKGPNTVSGAFPEGNVYTVDGYGRRPASIFGTTSDFFDVGLGSVYKIRRRSSDRAVDVLGHKPRRIHALRRVDRGQAGGSARHSLRDDERFTVWGVWRGLSDR